MLRSRQRGIALFITLLVTSVLIMMLTATMTSTHGGNIFSQDYHAKTAALYAAESGLALLQEKLEDNSNFTGPFNGETPFKTGEYSVRFGTNQSVNNLLGTGEKTCKYGPVPPGSAFIRVEGTALGQTEVVECMLGQRGDDFLHVAMVATGTIYIQGKVMIGGHEASDDLQATDADVISNDDKTPSGNQSNVQWDRAGADGTVSGTVRSAASGSNAISQTLKDVANASFTDQAPVQVKNINIKRAIQEKAGNSGIPGSNIVSPGDHYEGGDRTIIGDLVLDNASLYVNGDLKVIGSIKGVGAVYVKGTTTFSGDSEVVANEEGVALYSDGDVVLTGFDGTAWMDSVATSHGKGPEWEDTKAAFRYLDGYLKDFAVRNDRGPVRDPVAGGDYSSTLAGSVINHLANGGMLDLPPYSPGAGDNFLWEMLQVIKSEPPGTSRNFMERKFEVLRDPNPEFSSVTLSTDIGGALGIRYGGSAMNPPITGPADLVTQFLETGKVTTTGLQLELFLNSVMADGYTLGEGTYGVYAGLDQTKIDLALKKHAHWLSMYNFNRLGDSYFQGNIYTRGALFASNEVTIIGALSAVADPDRNNPLHNVEGIQMTAGDIYLGAGTRIEHVTLLKPGPRTSGTPVGVSYWLR